MSSNPMPSTPAGPGLKWELVPVVRNGQTFSRWTQVRDGASSAGAANSSAMAGVVPEYDDEDDEDPFDDWDEREDEALEETTDAYTNHLLDDALQSAEGLMDQYGNPIRSNARAEDFDIDYENVENGDASKEVYPLKTCQFPSVCHVSTHRNGTICAGEVATKSPVSRRNMVIPQQADNTTIAQLKSDLEDNVRAQGFSLAEFAEEENAEGACWSATNEIIEYLGGDYDVHAIGCGTSSGTEHYAVVLEDDELVLDYTIRQFFPDEDHPFVGTVDEWQSLMGIMADEDAIRFDEGDLDDLEVEAPEEYGEDEDEDEDEE